MMDVRRAKVLVIEEMNRLDITYGRVTGKTVSFQDLAGANAIVVNVEDVHYPNREAWDTVRAVAKGTGVILEATFA